MVYYFYIIYWSQILFRILKLWPQISLIYWYANISASCLDTKVILIPQNELASSFYFWHCLQKIEQLFFEVLTFAYKLYACVIFLSNVYWFDFSYGYGLFGFSIWANFGLIKWVGKYFFSRRNYVKSVFFLCLVKLSSETWAWKFVGGGLLRLFHGSLSFGGLWFSKNWCISLSCS